jgi:hypothetical protein
MPLLLSSAGGSERQQGRSARPNRELLSPPAAHHPTGSCWWNWRRETALCYSDGHTLDTGARPCWFMSFAMPSR